MSDRRRPTPSRTVAAARCARAAAARARCLRGRADDPAWVRPALLGLLAATALLYLVDLAASGYANAFYSAAVQAGTKSWKAFFFGSFDSSNFITVDKPPASLWVMELSARLFGVSSWSILVPQALEGVAAVGAALRDRAAALRAPAGLLAGAVLRAHAGRGADVPLQQPGRAADAAPRRRRLRAHPGARGRADAVARARRRRWSASAS